jgi:hypothetical protein
MVIQAACRRGATLVIVFGMENNHREMAPRDLALQQCLSIIFQELLGGKRFPMP